MIWIFTLETITDMIYERKSRLTCITGSIFFVVRDDPLKSMDEYSVICAVALLPRLGEYGMCKQEPKFFTQDLKQMDQFLIQQKNQFYYLAQEIF